MYSVPGQMPKRRVQRKGPGFAYKIPLSRPHSPDQSSSNEEAEATGRVVPREAAVVGKLEPEAGKDLPSQRLECPHARLPWVRTAASVVGPGPRAHCEELRALGEGHAALKEK